VDSGCFLGNRNLVFGVTNWNW